MEKQKRSQITIKGSNSDEKFKHLEVILRRMARRMNQTVVGVMPPSAIFQYVDKPDEKGFILRGILPPGEVTKICLAIGKYNTKKAVRFICGLRTHTTGLGKNYTFETHKGLLIEDVNLTINGTSYFTLRVESNEGEKDPLIEDIWITALFQFDQSMDRIKTLMLEELVKLEELDEGI